MTKLLALIAWIEAHAMLFIMLAIITGVSLFAVGSCKDKGDTAAEAVMRERIRQDSLQRIKDSVSHEETLRQLNIALANGVKVVDRWHESAPRPIPVGTPHDSITHLTQQVRECRQVGDSLVASMVPIKSACAAYRDTTEKIIGRLKTEMAHKDSLAEIKSKGKRVEYFGAGLYDWVGKRPVLRVGTNARAFWNARVTGELEYAIPRAKDTLNYNGLRALTGVNVKF